METTQKKPKWNLGHVYDVTDYLNKMVAENKIFGLKNNQGKCIYEHGYFVCLDVWDFHVYRIQVGINSKYDEEPRTKIIEQGNIRIEDFMEFFNEEYDTYIPQCIRKDPRVAINDYISFFGIEKIIKTIVKMDNENGYDNDDVLEFRYDTPLEELINVIDGAYGISKIELEIDSD